MTENATIPDMEEMPAPSVSVRIDRGLEWLGERFNPILVKESRQALKSRQFVLSFGLLLIAAWGWSFIGLVIMQVGGGYGQAGFEMFMGYYCILAAALALFVPFGAFRSLASEQEDQTYELLSITGLSPRQIVSGKLGSAVIQILIYTSAIAPCLAFTYMLRGISMPTILFAVTYTVLGALGLSIIGLLVGTLTKAKHWQVLLSVVLIVGLLIVFGLAIGFTVEMAEQGDYMFRDSEFWGATGAILTAFVTYAALVFYAAVAQITFVSDNRATKLRVIMLIQHGCLVAWLGWLFLTLERMEIGVLYIYLSLTAFHWTIMGAMMTGEWPELSMRVRRRLPQNFLGRAFLTWFNPGPGTGYMFACCGVIAASLTALALMFAGMLAGTSGTAMWGSPESLSGMCVLVPSYVIAYLGVGLLLVRFLRRFTQATLFVSVLIQILLISIGTAAPFILESILAPGSSGGYSLLQITNPFWTVVHMTDRNSLPVEGPLVMGLTAFTAAMVFTLNLPGIFHEVRHVRVAKPTRVIEEDREMTPEVVAPEPVPVSPWDVE
jgi:hypothetical protein